MKDKKPFFVDATFYNYEKPKKIDNEKPFVGYTKFNWVNNRELSPRLGKTELVDEGAGR